jgi:hypothetical protein
VKSRRDSETSSGSDDTVSAFESGLVPPSVASTDAVSSKSTASANRTASPAGTANSPATVRQSNASRSTAVASGPSAMPRLPAMPW